MAGQARPPAKKNAEAKSGIITLKPGEVLFHEGDAADCLFIIQSGQLRLYRPKGRGFIELAILRAGEVLGEMAYFDEKSSRRSCSAAAIIQTDIIRISFKAFEKTMKGLNPWFKTIINTLADRLRKTNETVKALESNSVGFGKGGKVGDYVFLHNSDIVKFFGLFYLVTKTHGEVKEGRHVIHHHKLKFYMLDIFALPEVKFEEFLQTLVKEKMVAITYTENNFPDLVAFSNLDMMRSLLIFFNTQRTLADEKKLQISSKCEQFLKKIFLQLEKNPPKKGEDYAIANVSTILSEFRQKNVPITEDDLKESLEAGLTGDIMVGEGNVLSTEVNYTQLKKILPAVRMSNALKAINEEKAAKY